MTTVTKRGFVNELSSNHGVVDTNNMSNELKGALKEAGIGEAELKRMAGPDGQIKGKEFQKLYHAVDRFDHRNPKSFQSDYQIDVGACQPKYGLTKEGKLYDALKGEVDRNRLEARYARPGIREAEAQPELKVRENALTVPEGDRKPNVKLRMKGVDQYDLHPDDKAKGDKACLEAATKQCNDYNTKVRGNRAPKLNGQADSIQVAYQEDKEGRLKADPTQAKLAREYIDKCLDKKLPVVVGTSYGDNAYNRDKLTDHFVTIHGRSYDEQGRTFYEFKDPGDGGASGRLYVDKDTGKLFKERTKENPRWVSEADYEVTQVRTYKGVN